jgi:hypothetical protein
MKQPITNELFKEWKFAVNRTAELSEILEERITFILQRLTAIFGGELDTWYFDEAEENEVGNLSHHLDSNSIDELHLEYKRNITCGRNGMVIIDKFGKEYGCGYEIPTRWLFEDFEQEIINGKKLYEEREADNKAKKKAASEKKKLEDQSLAAAAKKKLSKEELAALRRSL